MITTTWLYLIRGSVGAKSFMKIQYFEVYNTREQRSVKLVK